MINFTKSQPAPASLAVEKAKPNGSYNLEDVLTTLKDDFHNKCYLCEQKAITSLNVEHFLPHRQDTYHDLKFSWENLFFACTHCNSAKNEWERSLQTNPPSRILLDCTQPNQPVLQWIKHKINPYPKEKVSLENLCQNVHYQTITQNTVELLLRIYNGTTFQRQMESENLRDHLSKEVFDFQSVLFEYYYQSTDEDDKNILLLKIKRLLSTKSAFTAFKRWIVIENFALKQDFEKYFD